MILAVHIYKMKKYSAIIFDLFDTILDFNFNHLPTVELKGFRSRTTSKEVYEVFRNYHPEIGFTEFYDPFIESYNEFQEIKLEKFKEFPNRERFILMLDKMSLPPVQKQDLLIDQMVLAHMNALAGCIEYPQKNKELLDHLKGEGYRLAIVSNFDYAPTAHKLLERFELKPLFEEIIISEEVGWRKPKNIIFESVINKLGIEPKDALFVGDNFNADVVGSKALGMDAAWINRKNESESNLNPAPEYIIKKLPELRDFI